MNHLPNGAVAVGAPGSEARRKAEQEDQALGINWKPIPREMVNGYPEPQAVTRG